MSGYAFHPDAFADLHEIWEYIAEDNIDAADRVLADIHSTLTTLAESPQIGHRRPDLTTRPLRFHVVRDEYLIAYAPAEKPLCSTPSSSDGSLCCHSSLRWKSRRWNHGYVRDPMAQ